MICQGVTDSEKLRIPNPSSLRNCGPFDAQTAAVFGLYFAGRERWRDFLLFASGCASLESMVRWLARANSARQITKVACGSKLVSAVLGK